MDKIWVKLNRDTAPPAAGGRVNIGGHGHVHLPSVEKQREGFELPVASARLLLAQFPYDYKVVRNGGGSKHARAEGGPSAT